MAECALPPPSTSLPLLDDDDDENIDKNDKNDNDDKDDDDQVAFILKFKFKLNLKVS